MYYIGLDVHKKTISYCVKDGQRADSFAGCDSRYTIGLGPLDENSPPTVDGRHGSDYLHGLDLRSFPSARSGVEGGTSADAACDCRSQEEERSGRCQQDRRLLAVSFSAGMLHGLDGDSRAAAHVALLELLLGVLAILDIVRRSIPTCEASLFIQNQIKAGAMRSSKNLIGKGRIGLCAKSFILRVYDVLARQATLMCY
jgi:hypothetical protein